MRHILAAVACVLAGCAGDSQPRPLPIEAESMGGYAEIDEDWHSLPVRFELSPGLSAKAGDAPAYRLTGGLAHTDVVQLARAVGVDGPVTKAEYGWSAGVFDGTGLGFSYGVDRLFSVRSDYLPPSPCHDTFDGGSAGCAAPTTTTLVPPKPLPSLAAATRVARDAATRWGVTVTDATVVATTEARAVRVRFVRTVEGRRAKGFEFVVEVSGAGVSSAYGFLATPQKVGTYELTPLARAVSRLNAPGEAHADATTIRLRAVDVGLMVSYTGDHQVWLTPAYIFTTDDGRTVAAPAAKDVYFENTGN